MIDLEGCIAGVQEMISRSKRLRDFVAEGGDSSDPAFRISSLERHTLDVICLDVGKKVLPPESVVIEQWVISNRDVGGGIEEGVRTYENKLQHWENNPESDASAPAQERYPRRRKRPAKKCGPSVDRRVSCLAPPLRSGAKQLGALPMSRAYVVQPEPAWCLRYASAPNWHLERNVYHSSGVELEQPLKRRSCI